MYVARSYLTLTYNVARGNFTVPSHCTTYLAKRYLSLFSCPVELCNEEWAAGECPYNSHDYAPHNVFFSPGNCDWYNTGAIASDFACILVLAKASFLSHYHYVLLYLLCACTAVDSDEVQRCCPALVRGEKEIAMALAEGKFPVIDTTTDVFAIISSLGMYITRHTYSHMYVTCFIKVLGN